MTSQSPTSHPKRFYKTATAEQSPGGWTVLLDERAIKTPARKALTLPNEKLAKAIAAEWNAQGDTIDIAAMHLTRLANVAIDRAGETRYDMADELARYCETDLICHIAEEPDDLIEMEEASWRPVRDWAGETLGVFLVPVSGIIASPQPDASLEAAREHALSLDNFRLTGMMFACGLLGSALLALAVEREALTAEEAFDTARIDEDFQSAQWGEDDEAKAATAARRIEVKALGEWFKLLS
jgi:chaperone required for assembly of F1-ATPase